MRSFYAVFKGKRRIFKELITFENGGQASIFAVEYVNPNKPVPVTKTMVVRVSVSGKSLPSENSILSKLERDGRTLGGVVKVKGHFEICNGSRKIQLMERFGSENLFDFMGQNRQPVVKMMVDMIQGIAGMHSINLAHGDIKPENILVSEENRCKICDFGSAIDCSQPIPPNVILSTLYAPTEVLDFLFKKNRGYDPKKADIWSLGIVICSMLANGQKLFGELEITGGPYPLPILDIPEDQ